MPTVELGVPRSAYKALSGGTVGNSGRFSTVSGALAITAPLDDLVWPRSGSISRADDAARGDNVGLGLCSFPLAVRPTRP